jgi:hypothetical protein
MSSPPLLRRLSIAALSLSALVLAGCVSNPSQSSVAQVREQANPVDLGARAITNFTPALRCMDELMFDTGIRDVTLMMEDLTDTTQQVPVSARDMMTSAISDMTRRSRAVRLSVFGGDQQNLLQFLQQAEQQSPFAVVPQYSLRGGISQFDDSVEKNSLSVGASLIENLFGVRFGSETRFSVLGFDAAMVETQSLTLIPGVTTKNLTVIASRDASAADGQARLTNPGLDLVFSFAANRSEGRAQAARNMVELAAVELVGKLLRLPYWQCLGTADTEAEVVREMEDWFLSLSDPELISFLQERLRERRYYSGPANGSLNPELEAALASYRAAVGLPPSDVVDLAFFKTFTTAKAPPGPFATRRVLATNQSPATPPAASTSPTSPPPLVFAQDEDDEVRIDLRAQPSNRQRGLDLLVQVNRPGYLYCYSRDPVSGGIVRIFPNRFARDPRVDGGKPIRLPDGQRFVLNPAAEFACLHAPREVYGDLPPPLRWGDFEEIRLKSFDDIRKHFGEVSGSTIGMQVLRP